MSATWVVDEKGEPDGDWELSVIKSDNEHGIESYGWFDDDKICVWSDGGPCGNVAHPLLVDGYRTLAAQLADSLNREAQA